MSGETTAPKSADQEVGTRQPPGAQAPEIQPRAIRKRKSPFHSHAMTVHFPTALLPTALLFLGLSFVTRSPDLAATSYYLLGVTALSMPVVLATGYTYWKARYQRAGTRLFRRKIGSSLLCTAIVWALAVWGYGFQALAGLRDASWMVPWVEELKNPAFWLYAAGLFAANGAMSISAHLGGRLVHS